MLSAANPAFALTLGGFRDKYIPNDTMFSNQWALRNTGQLVRLSRGVNDVDMDVPEAWQYIDENIGDANRAYVIVAVLDSGVNYNHTDLRESILKDEDGNIKGYDFVNDDDDPADDNGHGTMMAGIIAAKRGNLRGISGINSYAKIMPVKILDKNGVGNIENLKKGIRYAADNGAEVISMSLVGNYEESVGEAIDYAYSKGIILVCASGSDDINLDGNTKKTPINNEKPGQNSILGVSAISNKGNRYGKSNYGKSIDISAPGESVISTYNRTNLSYVYASGTSLAAANVSGVASLVKSCFPEATNKEVISAIINSAKDISTLEDGMGAGVADAFNAIEFMANDMMPENPADETPSDETPADKNPSNDNDENSSNSPFEPEEYKLMRLNNDLTVFFIQDGVKRGIPRMEVFDAWGFSFSDVDVVDTLEEIEVFESGKLLGFPEGWVVKGSDLTVFEIQDGDIARPFTNPDAFIAHGHKWEDIMQVTDFEILNSYEIGNPIAE